MTILDLASLANKILHGNLLARLKDTEGTWSWTFQFNDTITPPASPHRLGA